jgi:hypothetical protein
MKLPKIPKIKQPKPVHVKPIKMRVPHQVKPKLPGHMKGGQQGAHQPKPVKPGLPPGALPPAPLGLPAPNTTYDFYISPNDAPAAPDQSAIKVHLEAEFEMATQHSQLDPSFRWTHRAYVQDSEDVRDTWPAAPANKVYIPDKTGVAYTVVFVRVINRNTPSQYKRVFLKRQTVTWPSDNV